MALEVGMSVYIFCLFSSTGLILYSQCFHHLLTSLQKTVNGVAKVNTVLNNPRWIVAQLSLKSLSGVKQIGGNKANIYV